MTSLSKKIFLLGIDGVGISQFEHLARRLPSSLNYLKPSRAVPLEGCPLASSQAVWAEILTAAAWSENGCTGYARPVGSLNDLSIYRQDDLLLPVRLPVASGSGKATIAVNLPLLKPRCASTVWLADGSVPSFVSVIPTGLADDEPFKSYKARPYSSLPTAMQDSYKSVDECLSGESNRIACTVKLLDMYDWSMCVMRVSAFDQLGHLMGPDFLGEKELRVSPLIDGFLQVFDRFLAQLLQRDDCLVFMVSGFTVDKCLGRVNLNEILAEGGFVKLVESAQTQGQMVQLRTAAALAVARARGAPVEDNTHLTSTTRFDMSDTIAASPVAGCIYVNVRDKFIDGTVEAGQYQGVKAKLESFLRRRLSRSYGGCFKLYACPEPVTSHQSKLVLPDFVLQIDGAELHDSVDPMFFGGIHKPRSTHYPSGFLYPPSGLSTEGATLRTTAVAGLMESLLLDTCG